MTDLKTRLRARPFRFGGETEAEAKERRQRDREEAADRIEALTAELDEAREDYGRESDQHDATAANLLAVEAERDKYKLIATHSEDVVRAAKVEIERLREALESIAEQINNPGKEVSSEQVARR